MDKIKSSNMAAASKDQIYAIDTAKLKGYRMPGEYEPHEGCLMIWPVRPGSWNYGGRAAQKAFCEVIAAISKSEHVYVLTDASHFEDAYMQITRSISLLSETVDTSSDIRSYSTDCSDAVGFRESNLSLYKKNEVDNTEINIPNIDYNKHYADIGNNITLMELETDDAWARDVGPTFVINDKGGRIGIDWKFNAWGGDVDGLYAHWDKDDAAAAKFCAALGDEVFDAHPFVLEGGSIHSDGQGTILTTEACLLSGGRNPQLSKAEIEEILCRCLGARKVIWLPHGIVNDETNEHVDNVCAFVRPGEVVLAWTDDENDPQYAFSKACEDVLLKETDAKGRPFIVHHLPVPSKPICIGEDDLKGYDFEEGEDIREVGERLAASYVNFYISNDGIVLPQFDDANDIVAVNILSELFPERNIYPITAKDILLGGGNIHCITQQIPERHL